MPTGPDQSNLATARVDKWLWAVRLFKTRTESTEACRAGHVSVNQLSAKPATPVRPGDTVEARCPSGNRALEVTGIIEKRAGAATAGACYIDHTPPPPAEAEVSNFMRPRGAGRPTKRDRRRLDHARGQ